MRKGDEKKVIYSEFCFSKHVEVAQISYWHSLRAMERTGSQGLSMSTKLEERTTYNDGKEPILHQQLHKI